MKQSFRSITILLTIILLLPALFFTGYELLQMNKNEKELETVYSRQLDAILFSINLYSEDIITSWASKIRSNIVAGNGFDCLANKKFLVESSQVKSLIIFNESGYYDYCSIDSTINTQSTIIGLTKLIADSSRKISRLKTYYRAGYYKTEQLGFVPNSNSLFYAFISQTTDKNYICILELDQASFIRELMGQKIQATAEDKLSLGINHRDSTSLVYTYGKVTNVSDYQTKKALWLFPAYEIGIRLNDKSVQVLSKERNKMNLLLIVVADLLFIIGAVVVFRNIRKEIRLTRIKSDFISNVSHEIRTPLALISMYAETLDMGRVKTEEKKSEYYQVIYNEAQRLSGIVNRILSFSKIESGKRTYNLTKSSVNELVSRIMQSYSFHLKNKGFDYQLQPGEDLPDILLDTEAIADAFINLLDNAIKYSVDKKELKVTTGHTDKYVFISVTDKGIGISKEEQSLVFDKFYRASMGNLAHIARGTGLGLTIVKNIIDAHRGKMELESTLGQGSTFRILLPMEDKT
jgi:two-component system, OmpR family, phosphate regulon sensor histidine kinase PhoR